MSVLRQVLTFGGRGHPPNVRVPDGLGGLGILLGIVVWELLARAADVLFLPPPTAVLERLLQLAAAGQLQTPLTNSLTNLLAGLGLCMLVGIPIGLLTGLSREAAAALDPYVNALLAAPALVFAPVFFAIWGLGRESIVAVIVAHAVFVLIVNIQAAVRNVGPELLEMAWMFSGTRRQLFRLVVIPAAAPFIFVGIRLAAGRAVKGMINGEMFIALTGFGKLIEDAQDAFDAAGVIAVLSVVILVAMGLTWVVDRISDRLTSWLPSAMVR
jgi:NitT/TauT family transport system permease protein